MSVRKLITNISRCSLHDGPGVRTVVYFAGCNLRCRWCHNPETISGYNHVIFNDSKCIKCGKCIEVCPDHHLVKDDKMIYIRDGCPVCGKCTEICPNKALDLTGRYMSVDEIFNEIRKDEHYYIASGGGVTFSGGECLLHPDFVTEIAKRCKDAGIHTAIESALFVPFENIENVLPYIDLFYTDLKIADTNKHKVYTGHDNTLIIENMLELSYRNVKMIIRIPVIPGVNDSDDDITGFSDIIRTFGNAVDYIELLKYNNLAESKYSLIEKEYYSFSEETQTDKAMKNLCDSLQEKCGIKCVF